MTFTTKQVAKAASVTLRQLQWMDETGVVTPNRAGPHNDRAYTVGELAYVALAGELRRRRVGLAAVRRMLDTLRASGEDLTTGWLLTDGRNVRLYRDSHAAMLEADEAGGRYAVLNLRRIHATVKAAARANSKPKEN